MQYDVAVIGTGPAGGIAACRLAETGLSTVVVEKDTLPRQKACSGAMSVRILDLIDWDFSDQIEAQTSIQHYVCSSSDRRVVTRTRTPMLFVERSRFDQHFIARALARGNGNVELREGVTIGSVREDEHSVTLSTTSGESIRAAYVIAADGAASQVARSLGLFRRPAGAAINAAVVAEQSVFEHERRHATFDFECVAEGYGWLFPKRDHLSCGVGMWSRPQGLNSIFSSFLHRTFPPGAVRDMSRLAHPVPVFQGHRPIATARTCLVGDAAHLVDPVLGEGIAYAIESGRTAADVVVALLERRRHRSLSCDSDSPRAGDAVEAVRFIERYGNCRAYQHIVRNGIARRLNLIRLNAQFRSFSPAPRENTSASI